MKEKGIALTTTDVNTIQIVKTQKQVVFKAEADIKKGQEVLVTHEQWLPYVFATLEAIACKAEKEDQLVYGLPKELLTKQFNELKDNNIAFLEGLSKKTFPELDNLKESKTK